MMELESDDVTFDGGISATEDLKQNRLVIKTKIQYRPLDQGEHRNLPDDETDGEIRQPGIPIGMAQSCLNKYERNPRNPPNVLPVPSSPREPDKYNNEIKVLKQRLDTSKAKVKILIEDNEELKKEVKSLTAKFIDHETHMKLQDDKIERLSNRMDQMVTRDELASSLAKLTAELSAEFQRQIKNYVKTLLASE